MTEAEWLAGENVRSMLHAVRGKVSNRKLWLFVVACTRRASRFLPEEIWRLVADLGERLAEGVTPFEECRATWEALGKWKHRFALEHDFERASYVRDFQNTLDGGADRTEQPWREGSPISIQLQQALAGAGQRAFRAARWASYLSSVPLWYGDEDRPQPETAAEQRAAQAECVRLQREALREIVGNPFRPPTLDPAWAHWNDDAPRRLAQAIHDARAFDRIPLLADALEDAGCTDGDILAHCRGPGPHVRGCWVIDLLLGKE
jgi:hypothetical protein